MDFTIPEYIQAIDPYEPGKPLEELEREYGIRDAIKMASNENPLGPSPKAVLAIKTAMGTLHRYPDGSGHTLVEKLAGHLGVASQNIILGNGSDEVIGMLCRSLLAPGDRVVMPKPSFLMYEIAARSVGAQPVFAPLNDALAIDLDAILDRVSSQTRLIFLCNPNNPTGTIIHQSELNRFLGMLPSGVTVVLDEAYIEFVRDPRCANGIDFFRSGSPVVSLRTFSKIYGLAGLRIGYGVMPAELAGFLHRIRQPFNASALAQVGAIAALDDVEYFRHSQTLVHSGIDYLFDEMTRLGIRCFPTQANFILIDVQKDADAIFKKMMTKGVIVRSMRSYGYPSYIRISAGRPQENERFVTALADVLNVE